MVFFFVSLLEALYLVNLTPDIAMKYREKGFLEVGKAMQKSLLLHDHFADCFPATFSKTTARKCGECTLSSRYLPKLNLESIEPLDGGIPQRKLRLFSSFVSSGRSLFVPPNGACGYRDEEKLENSAYFCTGRFHGSIFVALLAIK
jgi:hypothetical protein